LGDILVLRTGLAEEYLGIIKYLVESGVCNAEDKDKILTLSAKKGYFEIVKYLIESGANINAAIDINNKLNAYNPEILNYLMETLKKNHKYSKNK